MEPSVANGAVAGGVQKVPISGRPAAVWPSGRPAIAVAAVVTEMSKRRPELRRPAVNPGRPRTASRRRDSDGTARLPVHLVLSPLVCRLRQCYSSQSGPRRTGRDSRDHGGPAGTAGTAQDQPGQPGPRRTSRDSRDHGGPAGTVGTAQDLSAPAGTVSVYTKKAGTCRDRN